MKNSTKFVWLVLIYLFGAGIALSVVKETYGLDERHWLHLLIAAFILSSAGIFCISRWCKRQQKTAPDRKDFAGQQTVESYDDFDDRGL